VWLPYKKKHACFLIFAVRDVCPNLLEIGWGGVDWIGLAQD
jgi:hypothetical protein